MKRKQPESALQTGCVLWFRLTYRDLGPLLFSIPQGTRLAGTQGQRAAQWARLKREGAIAGAPDLLLCVARGGSHGLFIEMKTESGRMADSQKQFRDRVVAQGYAHEVVRSLEEFKTIINKYLCEQTEAHN